MRVCCFSNESQQQIWQIFCLKHVFWNQLPIWYANGEEKLFIFWIWISNSSLFFNFQTFEILSCPERAVLVLKNTALANSKNPNDAVLAIQAKYLQQCVHKTWISSDQLGNFLQTFKLLLLQKRAANFHCLI